MARLHIICKWSRWIASRKLPCDVVSKRNKSRWPRLLKKSMMPKEASSRSTKDLNLVVKREKNMHNTLGPKSEDGLNSLPLTSSCSCPVITPACLCCFILHFNYNANQTFQKRLYTCLFSSCLLISSLPLAERFFSLNVGRSRSADSYTDSRRESQDEILRRAFPL